MARPVNHERRALLLEAGVDYAIERGIADLSLRPMAEALGVTSTTLVHHFGTKDQLLEAILNRVRERIVAELEIPRSTRTDAAGLTRDAWAWVSSPSRLPLFRLFFEVYGRALREPTSFAPFLDRVVDDWLDVLAESFERDGDSPAAARTRATLGLAVTRGLLLDLLTTGDRARVDQALRAFTDSSAMATGETDDSRTSTGVRSKASGGRGG